MLQVQDPQPQLLFSVFDDISKRTAAPTNNTDTTTFTILVNITSLVFLALHESQ